MGLRDDDAGASSRAATSSMDADAADEGAACAKRCIGIIDSIIDDLAAWSEEDDSSDDD